MSLIVGINKKHPPQRSSVKHFKRNLMRHTLSHTSRHTINYYYVCTRRPSVHIYKHKRNSQGSFTRHFSLNNIWPIRERIITTIVSLVKWFIQSENEFSLLLFHWLNAEANRDTYLHNRASLQINSALSCSEIMTLPHSLY